MRTTRLVAMGTALLIVGGCGDDGGPIGPAATPRALDARTSELAASGARHVEASGHFDALVDFSTLTLTPRGENCLLVVKGALVFSGTLEGTAAGETSALVFAPCDVVATTPPGTFPDVFKSELTFEGTVDGEAAQAKMLYMGRVQPGGRIDGRLVLSNGVAGRLDADAVVAVGGEYAGSIVVP
ncbi:MAG TPA: hypothetical protein VFZ11_06550 [Gemmatimonadaceae bacterium]